MCDCVSPRACLCGFHVSRICVSRNPPLSFQVLQRALETYSLKMVPLSAQEVDSGTRDHPERENAFIANYQSHWTCLRRFGTQWYNLNSTLERPEPVSDTLLG